jgi:hypothetical protein
MINKFTLSFHTPNDTPNRNPEYWNMTCDNCGHVIWSGTVYNSYQFGLSTIKQEMYDHECLPDSVLTTKALNELPIQSVIQDYNPKGFHVVAIKTGIPNQWAITGYNHTKTTYELLNDVSEHWELVKDNG